MERLLLFQASSISIFVVGDLDVIGRVGSRPINTDCLCVPGVVYRCLEVLREKLI